MAWLLHHINFFISYLLLLTLSVRFSVTGRLFSNVTEHLALLSRHFLNCSDIYKNEDNKMLAVLFICFRDTHWTHISLWKWRKVCNVIILLKSHQRHIYPVRLGFDFEGGFFLLLQTYSIKTLINKLRKTKLVTNFKLAHCIVSEMPFRM